MKSKCKMILLALIFNNISNTFAITVVFLELLLHWVLLTFTYRSSISNVRSLTDRPVSPTSTFDRASLNSALTLNSNSGLPVSTRILSFLFQTRFAVVNQVNTYVLDILIKWHGLCMYLEISIVLNWFLISRTLKMVL